MKTRDILQSLALAAALAAVPPLFVSAASAEPAASPKAAQQKSAPPAAADDDDLSTPAAGAASKPTTTGAVSQTKAKDIAVGAAVYGSDGKKVGEIKGVKSESTGAVQEIHVIAADKTFVIPGSKIARGGQNVLLAMTSEEVGKLPALPDKKG